MMVWGGGEHTADSRTTSRFFYNRAPRNLDVAVSGVLYSFSVSQYAPTFRDKYEGKVRMKSGMFKRIAPPISRGNQSGKKPPRPRVDGRPPADVGETCPVCGLACATRAEVSEHLEKRYNPRVAVGDSVRCVNHPKLSGEVKEIDRDHARMTIVVRLGDGTIQQRQYAVRIVDRWSGALVCPWERIEQERERAPASERAGRRAAASL